MVEISKSKVLVAFDYCHEMKCLLTMLFKHDLFMIDPVTAERRLVSFKVLHAIWTKEKERHGVVHNASHLTEQHMDGKKCPKMKVSMSTEVFSNKTVTFLETELASAGKISKYKLS